MNNQKTKHKNSEGITLVALIITIIVLLILAVVAISAVQDGGIIKHAINAQSAYEAAAAREEEELQNYLNYLNENIPGQGNSENGGEEQQPQEPEDGGTEVEPPAPQEPTLELASGSDTNNDGKINYNETWTLALKDAQGNALSGVSYSSSDSSIATVNSNGVITGVSHGTATITATYTENGVAKTKKYDVNVVEFVETIIIGLENYELEAGGTNKVIVTTSPTTNPKGTFTYRSSNHSVAIVDSDGTVTTLMPGNFLIHVTYNPPEGSDGKEINVSSSGCLVKNNDSGTEEGGDEH